MKNKAASPKKQTRESGEASNSTPDKVIVKPDNVQSTVWHFFEFWPVGGKVVHKPKAVCELCDAELVYHSTARNLKLYLVNVHHRRMEQSR